MLELLLRLLLRVRQRAGCRGGPRGRGDWNLWLLRISFRVSFRVSFGIYFRDVSGSRLSRLDGSLVLLCSRFVGRCYVCRLCLRLCLAGAGIRLR